MRRIAFLLISLVFTSAIMAEGIDRNTALKKAQRFMPGKAFSTGKALPSARAKAPRKNDAFYIFNAADDGGYVIVSGDDRTTEILGYAQQGHLDADQLPENLKWWLDGYARQIEALGTSLQPAAPSAQGYPAAVEPLITTKWGQGEPYNLMCPDANYVDFYEEGYDADNRCITGCVATAMAQVMYYWKWPESCPELAGYSIQRKYNGQNYEENIKALPATTFKWDLMKDTYGSDETGPSADAVAELMRYCGQAIEMGYTPKASGAWVTTEDLSAIFQYSPNCRSLLRDQYSASSWDSYIYDELAARRPVLYDGRDEDITGHQFIVDGYDGQGLFHFNWGWNGHYDTYYVLSIADPYAGSGLTEPNGGYQYFQRAIIGVKPAEKNERMVPQMHNGDLGLSNNTATYTRQSTASDFSSISISGKIMASYNLQPTSTLQAEIGWGLYKDESLVQELYSKTTTIPAESWTGVYNNATLSFGAGLADGKYQLRQIYRFAGETEWRSCEGSMSTDVKFYYLSANISGTTLTVGLPVVSYAVNSLTISEEPMVGSELRVKANITNTGDVYRRALFLKIQKPGSSEWVLEGHANADIAPGMSGDISFSFVPEEAGVYNLKIDTYESEEAFYTFSVNVAGNETVILDGITYLCTPDYQRAMVIRNDDADKSRQSVTIRSSVTASGVDCRVTRIDDWAFYNWDNLESLSIPEGIESIGDYAFYFNTGLTGITLPGTLKSIGRGAFYNCNQILSLVIPEGVTSIGDWAFEYMFDLKTLELPSSLKEMGEYVISSNSALTMVISHSAEPVTISDNTFVNQSWDNDTQQYKNTPSPATLYIPIGTKAKYEAIPGWTRFAKIEEGERKETTVGIFKYAYATGGSSATVLKDASYQELTEVVIPATVSIDGRTYQVTAIGNNAFSACWKIVSLTLPEGLESIGNNAFYYNTGLTEITLPSTLKSIDYCVFYDCYRIQTLVIPEGVESIGNYAFAYMENLKKLELPSSLKKMGNYIISGNSALTTVISHSAEPLSISDNTFVYRDWNFDTKQYEDTLPPATLYVPIGTKAKYEALSGWTKFTEIEEGEPEPDGIISVKNEKIQTRNAKWDGTWYNLQGVKVKSPQKGVYIQNGRKNYFSK